MSVGQTQFHGALLDSAQPIPDGLTDGQGRPAGRRFSVYRNNVAVSLTDALEAGFPVISKLIGSENFRNIAGVFLRQHPPTSPMMSQYGAAFPDFLAGFEPLQKIGYLADVAQLEQALRVAYHAADGQPADASVLETLSPEAVSATTFTLAPAVRLLRFPWPVHAIWEYNMREGAPKPQAGAQNILITRPEFDPQMTPVSDGTAAFTDALMQGQTLAEANEQGLTADPEFDLSQALGLLLSEQAITQILTKD